MKAFADVIGITQGALSGLESGKSKPSSDTLASIVKHTNINPVWLLLGEGEMYAVIEHADVVNGDSVPLSNVVELQHIDVVKQFKDKPTAKRMNENLVDIERLSPNVFKKVDKYLEDTAETVRLTVGDSASGGAPVEDARKKKRANGKE